MPITNKEPIGVVPMPTVDRHEAGFTLIETMLASVILTVGLLALAGIQGMSLARNVDAHELSRATNLASDILERIQFNRRRAGEYNNIDVTSSMNCPAAGMGTMASGDCAQWRQLLLGSGLFNVRGQVQTTGLVTTPPLNQTQVTVTISWTSSARGEGITQKAKTISMRNVIAPE